MSLDVCGAYGHWQALAELGATFATGFTFLTGPSGAGRSTLLRIGATVERADRGTIERDGMAISAARAALRRTLGCLST